ncbi:MAG: PKD domain-containing protein [Planctomycetes bacterium]|nr:PKD domain-containing protein [Planctomycetota bacterium]
MRYILPGPPALRTWMPHATSARAVLGMLSAAIGTAPSALAQTPGSIIGWGSQVVGVDLSSGFVQVAAGGYHSLGLKADGSIVAWGDNQYGQSKVPASNTGFIGVAGGWDHSLGLKADGAIVAWGYNFWGQNNVPAPNDDFIAVAAGAGHSLGLKADGSIVAWGLNGDGQTNVPTPNIGFVAVAAGGYHSLGLKADGSIVAWGLNGDGQTNIPTPNTEFVAVAADGNHSLGLKADGSIVAWGNNTYGQTSVPAPNTGFLAVAAGRYHSLGLKADGSIVAWGYNDYGQTNVPMPNTGFVAVAEGWAHSLGLRADGSIVAWGSNGYGQTNVPDPNPDFVAVAAGGLHSLGLKADGSIVAWGSDDSGQTTVPAPNGDFVAVAAGWFHSLGLKADGSIVAWGSDDSGQTTVPAPNADFVAVAAGFSHSLGLKADGSIVAWGDNSFGQCDVPAPNTGFIAVARGLYHSLGLKADGSIVAWGYNSHGQANAPVPNTNFVAVSAGERHSLGVKSDGSIVAWGDNIYGQTGVPAPNTGVIAVAAGAYYSLALKADGAIVAWGDLYSGQGDVPVPNTGFIAVAAGGNHGLGLKADGSIVAWGDNRYGQCNVPAPNTGFIAVAAGGNHGLGLKADGSIVAWGNNDHGQTNVPAPNAGFIAVAAGERHSLGLKADGSIVAWGCGSSNFGQCNAPTGPPFVAVAAGDFSNFAVNADGSIIGWGLLDSGQGNVPVPNSGFIAVSAGDHHVMGLKSDGSIVAWGTIGQNQVPGPNTGFMSISAGKEHSMALKSDGSVHGWGNNTHGQLDVPSPNEGFVAVTGGGFHTLGLKADGSIVAWGDNDYGQTNVPAPNSGFAAISAGRYHSLAIRAVPAKRLLASPPARAPTATAGSASFSVSNLGGGSMPWSAAVTQGGAWLRITAGASGTNGGLIWVAYDANPDPGSRTGIVRVSAPAATPPYVDVSVVQAGTTPAASPTHFEFDPIAGPYLVGDPIRVNIRAVAATATRDGPPAIVNFNGQVDLTTNTAASVSPRYVTVQNGMWSGNLVLNRPSLDSQLHAFASGIRGISNAFTVSPAGSGTGGISGVVRAGILPRDGAEVSLFTADGTLVDSVTTPTRLLPGSFHFDGLPAATYRLLAEIDQDRSVYHCVSVSEGQVELSDLVLIPVDRPPVLLVAGILGSSDRGWTDQYPYIQGSALPDRCQLQLHDPNACISNPVWGALRRTLSADFTVLDVPWDWRARIVDAVVDTYLIAAIDEARNRRTPPWPKVRVVAHSLGGVLVRHYIQSGRYRGDIDRFAMCGTPNRGSAVSYYIWDGADARTADRIADAHQSILDLSACAPNRFYARSLENVYRGVHVDEKFDGASLSLDSDEWLEFVHVHVPGLEALLPTYPFLSSSGVAFGSLRQREGYQESLLWQLAHDAEVDRFVKEDDQRSDKVRTKLFLSDDELTVAEIPIGLRGSGDQYPHGQPIGDPLELPYGDGTVPRHSVLVGLADRVSIADGKSTGHATIMREYADEICDFLSHPASCSATRKDAPDANEAAEAQTGGVLTLSFTGFTQPYVFDGAGQGTGINPDTGVLELGIPASSAEVVGGTAGVSIADLANGQYVVSVGGLAGNVFSVDVGYVHNAIAERSSLRGIHHGNTIRFGIVLDDSSTPGMVLQSGIAPPTSVRAERVSGLARIAWDASPDPAVVDYNVYARPDEEPKFTLLGSTAGTAFDTPHAWVTQGMGQLWNYFVVAAAADGTESFFDTVVENRSPLIARFSSDLTAGVEPLAVAFQDESAGDVTAWAWDFESDGVIDSSAQDPAHTFTLPGAYTVSLTVGGPEGTDTAIRVGYVVVDPIVPPLPAVPGDLDGDRDVDLSDAAGFVDRLLGPFVDPVQAGWDRVDFDLDYDVDLRDAAAMLIAFGAVP